MAISARGKATFVTTALGSAVSLVMSLGFIYLTLPTTTGLMLAAFSGAAAAYLGGLILYNVFMLQNQKSKNSDTHHLRDYKKIDKDKENKVHTEYQIKKNNIKAYLFGFFTAGCTLMVAATSAVTTYQSGILLGQSLSFSSQLVFGFSIAFSIVLGLGVILGGYDQTRKFFYLIKGENMEDQDHKYLAIPEKSITKNNQFSHNSKKSNNIISENSLDTIGTISFFPKTRTLEKSDILDNKDQIKKKPRSFSF